MATTEVSSMIQIVRFEGALIWVKPVCDFFGIDYKWQLKVIQRDHLLAGMSETKFNVAIFGDRRERVLLSKKGFIRWIQLINPKTVNESLRDRFIEFQSMIFDHLFGSAERESKVREHYRRIKKLKSLKGKVSEEIIRSQEVVNSYLDDRFCQLSLPFSKPSPQIESGERGGLHAEADRL